MFYFAKLFLCLGMNLMDMIRERLESRITHLWEENELLSLACCGEEWSEGERGNTGSQGFLFVTNKLLCLGVERLSLPSHCGPESN